MVFRLLLPRARWLGAWAASLLAVAAHGQGWSGLAASNYSGSNGLYFNPSSIADARQRLYINLGGGNWSLYNNFLELAGPYTFWELISGQVPKEARNSKPGNMFSAPYLHTRYDGQPKFANLAAEIRLPAIVIGLDARQSLAFGSRARAFAQVSHADDALAHIVRDGVADLDSQEVARQIRAVGPFSFNFGAWQEFSATYARVLTPAPGTVHFFKAGLTAKYLVGFGAAYVVTHDMAGVPEQRGAQTAPATRDVRYGYTDDWYYGRQYYSFGNFYDSHRRLGHGTGLDLGVTYEFRPADAQSNYQRGNRLLPDAAASQYRLRLGASIIDLGRIHYDNPRFVHSARLGTADLTTSHLDTVGWHGLPAAEAQARRIFGPTSQERREFTASLPTALVLSADYRFSDLAYVSVLWQQSLLPMHTIGVRVFSSLMVAPRFEHKHFEVSVPVRWANGYRTLRPGALVRVGPAFVGTDDLGGILENHNLTGYDLYFGAAFVLHHPTRQRSFGIIPPPPVVERVKKPKAPKAAPDPATNHPARGDEPSAQPGQ